MENKCENMEEQDEIDELLYELFEKFKPKVSSSTQRAIRTAFERKKDTKED